MESNSSINKNDKLSKKYIIESSIKKIKRERRKIAKLLTLLKTLLLLI